MKFALQPFDERWLRECASIYVAAFAMPPWNETWPIESAAVRLQELIEIPRSVGLIGFADTGVLAGFIVGNFIQGPNETSLRVGELCVLPSYQRSGLGTSLMRALERVALEQGTKTVTLTTCPETVAYYETLGYRRQTDWIPMARDLQTLG